MFVAHDSAAAQPPTAREHGSRARNRRRTAFSTGFPAPPPPSIPPEGRRAAGKGSNVGGPFDVRTVAAPGARPNGPRVGNGHGRMSGLRGAGWHAGRRYPERDGRRRSLASPTARRHAQRPRRRRLSGGGWPAHALADTPALGRADDAPGARPGGADRPRPAPGHRPPLARRGGPVAQRLPPLGRHPVHEHSPARGRPDAARRPRRHVPPRVRRPRGAARRGRPRPARARRPAGDHRLRRGQGPDRRRDRAAARPRRRADRGHRRGLRAHGRVLRLAAVTRGATGLAARAPGARELARADGPGARPPRRRARRGAIAAARPGDRR